MQDKETYTLKELYDNLEVPYAKVGKMADMSEGTITRIRDGHPARRTTLNRLLRTFSTIYGRQLTLENVTGVLIEDKHKPEKTEKQPVLSPIVQTPRPISQQPQKRAYKPRDTGLPDGSILALDFARNHNVKRETFRDHMMIGLGDGLIHGPDLPEDGSLQIKDWVRYEERNKRVRKDGTIEKERYLTADQQRAALEFWKRHDAAFTECNDIGCRCHTVKNGEE